MNSETIKSNSRTRKEDDVLKDQVDANVCLKNIHDSRI